MEKETSKKWEYILGEKKIDVERTGLVSLEEFECEIVSILYHPRRCDYVLEVGNTIINMPYYTIYRTYISWIMQMRYNLELLYGTHACVGAWDKQVQIIINETKFVVINEFR